MTNEELKRRLKELIFEENRNDLNNALEGFNIGNLDNEGIFDNIQSIIEYYRTEFNS